MLITDKTISPHYQDLDLEGQTANLIELIFAEMISHLFLFHIDLIRSDRSLEKTLSFSAIWSHGPLTSQ